jgi:WbqC-like protein family
MNSILIESQFFPPIEYLARCVQTENVVIEAHEHFQKGSYRNRCHITGANGLQVLSVPLRRNKDIKNDIGDIKNDIRSIKNIKIAYDVDWQKQHWRTLQTAYGSAPFWDFYAPILERFFTEKFDYLLDYNVEILKTIFKLLKIEKTVNISLSTTYNSVFTEGSRDGRENSDFRNTISPKINSSLNPINYSQLFNDRYAFIPHLSVLDLLFCCGNQSLSILKNTQI